MCVFLFSIESNLFIAPTFQPPPNLANSNKEKVWYILFMLFNKNNGRLILLYIPKDFLDRNVCLIDLQTLLLETHWMVMQNQLLKCVYFCFYWRERGLYSFANLFSHISENDATWHIIFFFFGLVLYPKYVCGENYDVWFYDLCYMWWNNKIDACGYIL